jgi:hypothetical protein
VWSEIVVIIFGFLLYVLGFVLGKLYENRRVMERLEALTHDMNPDVTPSCGNCWNYNGTYCTKEWNNNDESYLNKERDSKDPDDEACEDWSFNPVWTPED